MEIKAEFRWINPIIWIKWNHGLAFVLGCAKCEHKCFSQTSILEHGTWSGSLELPEILEAWDDEWYDQEVGDRFLLHFQHLTSGGHSSSKSQRLPCLQLIGLTYWDPPQARLLWENLRRANCSRSAIITSTFRSGHDIPKRHNWFYGLRHHQLSG